MFFIYFYMFSTLLNNSRTHTRVNFEELTVDDRHDSNTHVYIEEVCCMFVFIPRFKHNYR